MATVTLDKKLVMKLLKKVLTDKELEDRISMLGSEVDHVDDREIVTDVLANRPDMLSEHGLVRQLNGFIGGEKGLRNYTVKKSNYSAVIEKTTEGVRPYALCAVVRGLHMTEENVKSLMQLQEKIHATYARKRKQAAIGVHDLNAVEFPVKYTTVKGSFSFIPLGYKQTMSIDEILKIHPKGVEYANLLPKKDYPVWIDAKNNVLSLPSIINANRTSVTEKTRDIFVDVTGTDARIVENVLNIVVCSIADMGGEVHSVEIGGKEYPDLKPRHMKIEHAAINKLLGTDFSHDQIAMLLHRMRFGVEEGKALIPPYRVDIMHQVDLAEEVAIAFGYENFKPEIPKISTIGEEIRTTKVKRLLGDLMTGFGYLECITYSLSNEDNLLKKMRRDVNLVKTKNSVNQNYDTMRNSVLPSLLKVLSENKHHTYPQRIYEIGRVFHKSAEISEHWSLCGVTSHYNAEYTEMKSVLESLFANLGHKISFKDAKDGAFLDGRSAEIHLEGRKIGMIGEIHPQVLNNFELENPVAVFEIEIDHL